MDERTSKSAVGANHPESGERTLIYIPVIHTQAELGALSETIQMKIISAALRAGETRVQCLPFSKSRRKFPLNSTGLSTQTAKSTIYGSYASPPSPASDPESPYFVLQRVDVSYQFSPLIPGTPFGLALLPASVCSSSNGTITCTFHQQVSVRAMD